jgi:hypothetical protein
MAEKLINPLLKVVNKTKSMINPYMVSGVDADAQAFLTTTGITDAPISAAINTFVLGLKSNNLWDKMKAIYPFVGGSAAAHKFNLKDPRDLDAAFRLVYSGSVIHASTGIKGSAGYANTKLIADTHLTNSSCHISYYSRTSVTEDKREIGTSSGTSGVNQLVLSIGSSSLKSFAIVGTYPGNFVQSTDTNSRGFYTANGQVTYQSLFRNGSEIKRITANPGIIPITYPIYILAQNNNGSPFMHSNKECAFASIGEGLTDTNASNLYTLVQALQTALGRQV